MNIRVTLPTLDSVRRTPTAPAHRTKFNPRADILDEVVAGLLWMTLDLPSDISRPELETFAHQLVTRIKFGAGASSIEDAIAFLQSDQLGRPVDQDAIRGLTARVINAVKGL